MMASIDSEARAITKDPAHQLRQIRAEPARVLLVLVFVRWRFGDFVPRYDASDSQGIGVPKNTPYETGEKLNKEINVILADPKLKARFYNLRATVLPGSPAELATLMAEETGNRPRW